MEQFKIYTPQNYRPVDYIEDKKTVFDKKEPYISLKYGNNVDNNNCEFYFKDDEDELITCRHFATDYILNALNENKDFLGHYASEQSIQFHMTADLETIYDRIIDNTKKIYAIDNNDFGLCLSDIFTSMKNRGRHLQALLIRSPDHAMAARLLIKQRDTDLFDYVVNFYDPNHTSSQIRVCLNTLSDVEHLRLDQFIYTDCYNDYYPKEPSELSCIFVIDDKTVNDKPQRSHTSRRRLTQLSRTAPLLPCANLLSYLSELNLVSDLKIFVNDVTAMLENATSPTLTIKPRELYKLFYFNRPDYFPRSLLMKVGHYCNSDTINYITELLGKLPNDKIIELASTQEVKGYNALMVACMTGNINLINAIAYLTIKKQFTQNDITTLLSKKSYDGQTVLSLACKYGHADVITALTPLIRQLSPNVLFDLIASNHDLDIPFIFYAIEYHHVVAANTNLRLLNLLSPQQYFQLFDF